MDRREQELADDRGPHVRRRPRRAHVGALTPFNEAATARSLPGWSTRRQPRPAPARVGHLTCHHRSRYLAPARPRHRWTARTSWTSSSGCPRPWAHERPSPKLAPRSQTTTCTCSFSPRAVASSELWSCVTYQVQERTTPPHPTTPCLRAAPCRRTFRPRRRANSFCRPGSAGGRSSTTPAGSSGSSASSAGSQVSAATTTSPPGCRTPPDQLTAECNSRCRVHLETRVTSPRTDPSFCLDAPSLLRLGLRRVKAARLLTKVRDATQLPRWV